MLAEKSAARLCSAFPARTKETCRASRRRRNSYKGASGKHDSSQPKPLYHMTKKLSRDKKSFNSLFGELGPPIKNILGAQMRAARSLLRWAASDLVRESGVSLATIHRAESVDRKTAMTLANASAIRRALEHAGVELIEDNGGGPGARLKRRLS